MSQKVAYILGPVTSFNGALAAHMARKGWQVHFACKSSLNLLSLSPLDLRTQAQTLLEAALGQKEDSKFFKERLKLVDPGEALKNTKYDAIIFGALPPNFDEARAPRAPWSGADFKSIVKAFRGVPVFIVSSLWGGVQKDGVVPEELEFTRRKALTNWESTCQQYEQRMLESLSGSESPWYLLRLPLLSGDTDSGDTVRFSGIYSLVHELVEETAKPFFKSAASNGTGAPSVKLAYNPDSTLWYLPVDMAVDTVLRFIEDEARPRICNLVSTQTTLNREWLSHLAEALGIKDINCAEQDSLNIPNTLRKLLLDDVQVKTRNLYEVAGRYHLLPVRLDRDYFEKLIDCGRKHNWGEVVPTTVEPPVLDYSEQMAHYYFEKFLPKRIEQGALKDSKLTGTVAFHLRAANIHGWLLKCHDGISEISPYDPSLDKPDICLHFSGMTLSKLVQNKMLLHRAVLMREVEAEGNLLKLWRLTSIIDKFLKENPLAASEIPQPVEVE
jgi:hypothetical protein